METENENKNVDALNYITTIKQNLYEQFFKEETNILYDISLLPKYIQYTITKIINDLKMNKSITNCDILKLEFITDCLNDEFNTGYWRDVDIYKRKAYTIASCLKILINLQDYENIFDKIYIKKIIKCVDIGLLLGAPISDETEDSLLSGVGADLMKYFNKYINSPIQSLNSTTESIDQFEEKKCPIENIFDISAKKSFDVTIVKCPQLEYFYEKFFRPQISAKLTNCMNTWPAIEKWKNWDYFITLAGERTVPVEIGSHYADENWSQKLMTIREFIDNYIKVEHVDENNRGYLAQHNLFDQIPELRDDIIIPDYCALSNDDSDSPILPEINAWFGPKGTISPLHYDPKHNLLSQVIGAKLVILFAPEDTEYLYPHDDRLLNNTAQVNPLVPNLKKFPNYTKAKMWRCYLQAGEMLYIPPKWWHHVVSLDKSFSVSFWWK